MELLKHFQLKDIIISEEYQNTQPNIGKYERAKERYQTAGELPTNIVINDDNVLIDGYITYLLAVENEVERIDVYRGYVEAVEAVHYPGSQKRYMWKVPFSLIGQIKTGDYVIVSTAKGAQRVKVVNVIRQQYPNQNIGKKSVFKKCKRKG